MTSTQILFAISQTVIGVFGAIIAMMLYNLNRQNRLDAWYRTLRDFHHFFWTDESCSRVRSWLACDAAYEDVSGILKKRLAHQPLTKDEYKSIEEIDRFAALLVAYKQVEPNFPRHREVSYRLFDDYWLGCLTYSNRKEFRKYIERFFSELCENLPAE